MDIRILLTLAAVLVGVVGAALGVYAAAIEVHSDIDIYMDDMSHKAWWVTRASVAGCFAVGLLAIERLIQLREMT